MQVTQEFSNLASIELTTLGLRARIEGPEAILRALEQIAPAVPAWAGREVTSETITLEVGFNEHG